MTVTHNLGYPRIGLKRELKHALEAYWRGDKGHEGLEATGRELRQRHWQQQREAGLDTVPVGDFAWYDGVVEHSLMFGAIPERFGVSPEQADLDTAFRMARGRAPTGEDARPCEMTKWFNTNYHYIVPELEADQSFSLNAERFLAQVDEAIASGYRVKPVVLAPATFLALAKPAGEAFDKLGLLDRLLPVYQELLRALAARDIPWVQLDEPLLVTDLDKAWGDAIRRSHQALEGFGVNRLVTSYFGGLGDNRELALGLSKEGLHIDLAEAPDLLAPVADGLPAAEVLSAGVVDGRNVWCSDLEGWLDALEPIHARLGERLWLAPSSSLLHVPLDVTVEDQLDDELRSWLAFARQKCQEIATLGRGLNEGRAAIQSELETNRRALETRRRSERTYDPAVRRRTEAIRDDMARRSHPYAERAPSQHEHLNLPLFPTTTIGSFPQISEIRKARRDHRAGRLSTEDYNAAMREAIAYAVRQQEAAGLDVLVHGEAERNDMVEYFGELMDGFSFTRHGWVQSFGSRGVKPPIIHGDVSRPAAMTVGWSQYAASLTDRCMKGMLTGPVTILQWSFVRDDQPHSQTCEQIALALRDEVTDLEAAGIEAIQVDEPAFREGLPLRRADWRAYLDWATRAFRLATSGVRDATQIHTHMCYAEFNDIIEAIAALDADVITIETSRSAMELLRAFENFDYPNEIGPGVWDIHSPRLPSVEEMVDLLQRAAELIPAERLWVNPDCGLKTRNWDEVTPALANMVSAAQRMRDQYGSADAG